MKPRSRVLIVDDMIVNRMMLSSLFEAEGVSSDEAASGAECLLLCSKNDYDLILLDHRMPGMDGVDTLVVLKDIYRQVGRTMPPVICHTTSSANQYINLYKAAGFSDVIIKPIETGQISDIVSKYLDIKTEKPFAKVSVADAASARSVAVIGDIDDVLKEKLVSGGLGIATMEENLAAFMSRDDIADVILYSLDNDKNNSLFLLRYLSDFCLASKKSLVVLTRPDLVAHVTNNVNTTFAHIFEAKTSPGVVSAHILALSDAHRRYRYDEKRILIIGDGYAESACEWGQHTSYSIDVAVPEDAARVLTDEFDLIIIDSAIPDTAALLKKIRKGTKVPILFIADDSEGIEQAAERPDGYFKKPMDKSEWINFLDSFFAKMIFKKFREKDDDSRFAARRK